MMTHVHYGDLTAQPTVSIDHYCFLTVTVVKGNNTCVEVLGA